MRKTSEGVVCVLMVSLLSATASADFSDVVFHLDTERLIDPDDAGQGICSGSFEVTSDELVYDEGTDTWKYDDDLGVDIVDGAHLVAALTSLHLTLVDDPLLGVRISMNFAAEAGAAETTFAIRSGVVSFDTIAQEHAAAKASATFSVTDTNGDASAVLEAVGPPGQGMYIALYNDASATFASLVAKVAVSGMGASAQATQVYPAYGFESIDDDLYNVSSEIGFTLTIEDLMSATTGYSGDDPPPPALGDLNCDGTVDNFDIDAFVLALVSAPQEPPFDGYDAAYPECDHMLADCNEDGTVDNFDIDTFAALVADQS